LLALKKELLRDYDSRYRFHRRALLGQNSVEEDELVEDASDINIEEEEKHEDGECPYVDREAEEVTEEEAQREEDERNAKEVSVFFVVFSFFGLSYA
jgi:hypothetical protein